MCALLCGGVVIILFSFFMSASRLLNCFLIVENVSFLLVMLSALSEPGVLFLALVVVFTVESALALVVLFRIWDSSTLSDVVVG